ncbi:MAG: site-2 protease family protein, partial [Alphaproteobacteria bacterium]|nr:site-2 protease family protein [Alphaproteobacteria bacterium]
MDLLHKFLAAPEHFAAVYVIPFVVVLSVLVFVHEWGHYIVARLCGVRVETFSIGFGREIFGWTNKAGTRWKVSWLPFGGYVQMFGDMDPASAQHADEKQKPLTAEE